VLQHHQQQLLLGAACEASNLLALGIGVLICGNTNPNAEIESRRMSFTNKNAAVKLPLQQQRLGTHIITAAAAAVEKTHLLR
jgi:hypothetical protein